ncbi:MAG: ABC transporter ATP-binding protein [Candidatus Aminicenantes bacterium]|nr:ABC transporter ATP-binding protein [Candidatus Aminicenantes bacterium]
MSPLFTLFSFVRPYRKRAAAALLGLALLVVMDLAIPRLIQKIIDQGIALHNPGVVVRTALLMLGISVLSAVIAVLNNILSVQVGEGVARDLRQALFRKIQTFSYGDLDRMKTGLLMVRLTSDTSALQRLTQVSLRIGTRAPLLMVGSLILMVRTSPSLALTILPLLGVTSAILILFVLKMEPLFRSVQQKLDRLNTVLQENIAGARLVKAFVRADHEGARFGAANEELTGHSVRAMRFMSALSPALTVCINIGMVLVIGVGGRQAIAGRMSIGQIVAFTNYLLTTMTPLVMMTMLSNIWAGGLASAKRVREVLATVPEVQDAPDAVDVPVGAPAGVKGRAFAAEVDPRAKPGALTRDVNTRLSTAEADPQTKPGAPAAAPAAVDFEHVSFHYRNGSGAAALAQGSYPRASTAETDPQAKPGALTRDVNTRLSTAEADPQTKPGAPAAAPAAVLEDVELAVEAGQTAAVLGATGSGKSSLVLLVPRLYDVTAGSVRIDGADVRRLRQASLLGSIGLVPQDTVLFSGTVRDNIRYGRPDAAEADVVAAAKTAQAHEFIIALPQGYDSRVEARGANFSGGQKQRLAIARALLIRPRILILDDSTSAVDIETETRIQAGLATDDPTRITFVVAQRISTVLNADTIVVLDKGRVVAQGRHSDLIQTCPIYREIYDSQLGGESAPDGPEDGPGGRPLP